MRSKLHERIGIIKLLVSSWSVSPHCGMQMKPVEKIQTIWVIASNQTTFMHYINGRGRNDNLLLDKGPLNFSISNEFTHNV